MVTQGTDLQSIGLRIEKLRQRKKWSQQMLADKLGITRPQVSYIERGKRDLKTYQLVQLANIFNISTDYILFGMTDYSKGTYDVLPPSKPTLNQKTLDILRNNESANALIDFIVNFHDKDGHYPFKDIVNKIEEINELNEKYYYYITTFWSNEETQAIKTQYNGLKNRCIKIGWSIYSVKGLFMDYIVKNRVDSIKYLETKIKNTKYELSKEISELILLYPKYAPIGEEEYNNISYLSYGDIESGKKRTVTEFNEMFNELLEFIRKTNITVEDSETEENNLIFGDYIDFDKE